MRPEVAGKVLVTGAAGFIGRDVVRRLAAAGWPVRAMVRGAPPAGLGGARVEIVRGDVTDAGSLRSALAGAGAVVHLAARLGDESDSERVNVGGARHLVASCAAAGCRRVINVSTQSAKIARQGAYGRSKRRAEEVFEASGLAVTTLRPSVVYGADLRGVFGTVARFVRKLPVVPVLGDGRWISAPVWVGDVSAAIVACLANDATAGKTYDIGGPDRVSFDALIDRIAARLGRRRRKIHVPLGLALAGARALSVLPRPPVTISNVLGSNQDTDIDIEPARRDFGFAPIGLDEGLGKVFGPAPGDGDGAPASAAFESGDEEGERGRAAVAAGGGGRCGERDADPLRREFRRLSRYLLDWEPPSTAAELEERYARAHRVLLGDRGTATREWAFVERHAWSLPFLDAACALVSPHALLRRKVLLAAAVLEASTWRAGWFLAAGEGSAATIAGSAWQAVQAVVKAAVGLPIWLLARRG